MYQNNGYQQNGYQNQGYQGGGYQQNATHGTALGWDDEFTADISTPNPQLPEGDYWFEVVKLERARHPGSDKTPPCNKAIVTFRILAPQGEAIVSDQFFVIDLDWAQRKNTSLFASIGFASREDVENGRKIKPHWSNEIAGRRGVCHIAPRTYTKDGTQHTVNDLKTLYPTWKQPNVEPVAPPQNTGYMQPNQGYQTAPAQGYQPPAQGYNPAQNAGYQPQNGWNGGGIY